MSDVPWGSDDYSIFQEICDSGVFVFFLGMELENISNLSCLNDKDPNVEFERPMLCEEVDEFSKPSPGIGC